MPRRRKSAPGAPSSSPRDRARADMPHDQAAGDFEELRGWVVQWAANLGLKWTDTEVTDVAVHLNARYYRFACPPVHCKATGSRDAGAGRLALDDRRP